MESVTSFIESAGVWAYILAPLFMVAVAILPIPAEIPAMLNGLVFGSVTGTIITWSGALLGAVVSRELSRRFGRPLAQRLLSTRIMAQLDRVTISASWPALLVLRLVPVVAFTALNWAAGLTPLKRWTFVWTTALGIIPGALLFTISGTGLGWFYRTNHDLAFVVLLLAMGTAWITVTRYRRASIEAGSQSAEP